MTGPRCPNCEKNIDQRHTYMASYPLTMICSGCGSWLQVDVKRSGARVVALLCLVTVGLAFVSPYFLILLPLYFVASVGPLQRFSVDVVKQRKAELWTISRRSGELRPLQEREREALQDLALSKKLADVSPMQAMPDGHRLGLGVGRKRRRRCDRTRGHEVGETLQGPVGKAPTMRPPYNLDDLPTGLPG